ncbi:MAG: 4-hydroxyphenylacetate 3-hydroxylase family protein [Peptococcaceae bacterium]|jgi:4-hydroxybutyryl-CoA dehydratase/vinylacetyl-CoA-Delta-isomerase|nr:4-hydroxyphenylacetate 3-hydroxylase family protein [Peptococcaceae bacterium]MDH7525579.1 4-hydroxyphenylacetate 3-hydroxylase family protein [Peptococcaceae bacterium]
MKTGAEYVESLRRLKPNVYIMGEKVDSVVDHPLVKPHINSAALTYDLAHDPLYKDLMVAKSHLTGKPINRFTHIHQNTNDLVVKVKMLRMIAQKTASCFQRCAGFDAMNSVYNTTYEVDQAHGTEYHQRFKEYLKYVQENDIIPAGVMTDSKGNRMLKPSQQKDPDLFVRVVSKNKDGIVIRGAKLQQTGIVNAHEFIIMPTTAMGPEDKDYAVSCAVPVDAPGVTHVFGRQTNDARRYFEKDADIDLGNARYGMVGGEALTILEDVFVPWERVFLFGETEFAGMMVERFASFHRPNYGGCKAGVADVIIGAAKAIADYNGTTSAAHIRDKLSEMVHLNETLYCGAIACSAEGVTLPSGGCFVNNMLANTVKLNVTRYIYEIGRLAHDIAGGILATMPSEHDLKNPEIGPKIRKYYQGVAEVPTENRMRMVRLLESLTGGTAQLESMHGAGSPQAMKVMITRLANLDQKKKLAEELAGIKK